MSFAEIQGQDTVIAAIQRSLATGKVAHAYLFSGVDGCGKMTTALAFIAAVFCGRESACGNCPSCRKMAGRQHPDLHLVEPDGAFIKIDQIRELQRELAFRPFEAPKKACIIQEADRLNPASGNALLKTLEEPPGNALMILLTSATGAVLPTILSRCQQLQFRPLSREVIENRLHHQGVPPEAARLAATLAGGSLSRAEALITELSLSERSDFLTRVLALSRRDIAPLFAAAEEFSGDKEKALTLLELLSTFLRDVMLLKAGSDDLVNTDLIPLLKGEAERLSLPQIMKKCAQVAETRQALLRNVNARLALDMLFMRLAEA